MKYRIIKYFDYHAVEEQCFWFFWREVYWFAPNFQKTEAAAKEFLNRHKHNAELERSRKKAERAFKPFVVHTDP